MDIIGGQLTQTNGNPSFPGAVSTGPLIAGNVVHSDGSGTLAGVGGVSGIANQGYAAMTQISGVVTQAAAFAGSGAVTSIVIPAQSMIVRMLYYVTTAWTGGTTTFGITDTASNSYSTASPGNTIGVAAITQPATKSVIQQWQNVGSTDVQLVVTATNTGSGTGVLFCEYIQGINSAMST
jgi:hypothetical protein